MAEIITIAGAIETALSLSSSIKAYVDDARGAKNDLQSLATKIDATFNDVSELQSLIVVDKSTPNWNEWGLARANRCVNESQFVLQKLAKLLLKSGVAKSPDQVKTDINPSVWGSMLWPFYKPQIREIQDELVLLKIDINSALTTWKNGPDATPNLKRLAGERLQRYQVEREYLMKRLVDAKTVRLQRQKENPESGSESDPADSNDVRAHRAHLSPEERRIFKEWEDAVAEKVIAEQKVEETKVKEAQERDDEIRRQYVKSKFDEAQKRADALKETQRRIVDELDKYDIPPNDRLHMTSAILEKVQPSTEDDRFIRAAFPNGAALRVNPLEIGLQDDQTAIPSRRWFVRGKQGTNNSKSFNSLPDVLQDPNAPGGVAVLAAIYFAEDPFGEFQGVQVATTPQATHRWMKKHGHNIDNVSMNFRILPENCKDSILDILEQMSSWSPDYTWRLLLVHREADEPNKSLFGIRRKPNASEHCVGAYVIFKRQLRHAKAFKGSTLNDVSNNARRESTPNETSQSSQNTVGRDGANADDDNEDPQNAFGPGGPPYRPPGGSSSNYIQSQNYINSGLERTARAHRGTSRSADPADELHRSAANKRSEPAQALERKPIFPKIRRVDVALETLDYYGLQWKYDPKDPDYVIILREMSVQDTDIIFEHTRRLRNSIDPYYNREDDRDPMIYINHSLDYGNPSSGPRYMANGSHSRGYNRPQDYGNSSHRQRPRASEASHMDYSYPGRSKRAVTFADNVIDIPNPEESELETKEWKIREIEERMADTRSKSNSKSNIYYQDSEDRKDPYRFGFREKAASAGGPIMIRPRSYGPSSMSTTYGMPARGRQSSYNSHDSRARSRSSEDSWEDRSRKRHARDTIGEVEAWGRRKKEKEWKERRRERERSLNEETASRPRLDMVASPGTMSPRRSRSRSRSHSHSRSRSRSPSQSASRSRSLLDGPRRRRGRDSTGASELIEEIIIRRRDSSAEGNWNDRSPTLNSRNPSLSERRMKQALRAAEQEGRERKEAEEKKKKHRELKAREEMREAKEKAEEQYAKERMKASEEREKMAKRKEEDEKMRREIKKKQEGEEEIKGRITKDLKKLGFSETQLWDIALRDPEKDGRPTAPRGRKESELVEVVGYGGRTEIYTERLPPPPPRSRRSTVEDDRYESHSSSPDLELSPLSPAYGNFLYDQWTCGDRTAVASDVARPETVVDQAPAQAQASGANPANASLADGVNGSQEQSTDTQHEPQAEDFVSPKENGEPEEQASAGTQQH